MSNLSKKVSHPESKLLPRYFYKALFKEHPDDRLPCSFNLVDTGVSVASILGAVAAVSLGSSR